MALSTGAPGSTKESAGAGSGTGEVEEREEEEEEEEEEREEEVLQGPACARKPKQ